MPFLSVSAAEERGGCQFWRGSAEEAAGGGGTVQSGPLSIHVHPGPCSQDQRTSQTVKKLKDIYTKTGKDIDTLYRMKSSANRKKTQEMRHFTFCNVFFVL